MFTTHAFTSGAKKSQSKAASGTSVRMTDSASALGALLQKSISATTHLPPDFRLCKRLVYLRAFRNCGESKKAPALKSSKMSQPSFSSPDRSVVLPLPGNPATKSIWPLIHLSRSEKSSVAVSHNPQNPSLDVGDFSLLRRQWRIEVASQ